MCLWPVYAVSMHGRSKKFTVKHFCEMGVCAKEHNIISYDILTKMLNSKLFKSAIVTVMKLAKDTPDLFLCQALHFQYGSNHR